jgi:hypothetical protein
MKNKIAEKRSTAGLVNYKKFAFDVKAPSVTGRTISGYLAVFNNMDSDGDIIIKGAFAKSINDRGPESSGGNKIAFLWQHDMREPLGKMVKLVEDDFGLYFEAALDEIELADRCLKQLESGTLNNFSIGFQYIWEKMEYDQVQDAYICKELALYEGSVVTLAANDMTYYAGLKAEQVVDEIAHVKDDIEAVLATINSRKSLELRQYMSRYLALCKHQPPAERKEALKGAAAAKPKRTMFATLGSVKQ